MNQMLTVFIVVVLILIGCFVVIGVGMIFWLFRSKDKDADREITMIREKLNPLLTADRLQEKLLESILAIYEAYASFPTYLEFIFSGDPRYNWRAMLEDFRRDRDIRWLVLVCALPQFILPAKKQRGFSKDMHPQERFVSRMEMSIFSGYVLDRLIAFAETQNDLSASLRKRLEIMIDSAVIALSHNARLVNGAYLFTYGNNPQIDNPRLNRIMSQWGVYNDSDSSMVILAVFRRFLNACRAGVLNASAGTVDRIRVILEAAGVLDHLSTIFKPVYEYVLPRGRTEKHLNFSAYLCYFTGGANDADPVLNMNVLNGLFANYQDWKIFDRPETIKQIHSVLNYLYFLADSRLLFSPYQHQYYTIPAMAYIWKRFFSTYQSLPEKAIGLLDPQGRTILINQRMDEYFKPIFQMSVRRQNCNLFDLALFLQAYPEETVPLQAALLKCLKEQNGFIYELFCAVYPIKIIYGSPAMLLSCLLNFRKI